MERLDSSLDRYPGLEIEYLKAAKQGGIITNEYINKSLSYIDANIIDSLSDTYFSIGNLHIENAGNVDTCNKIFLNDILLKNSMEFNFYGYDITNESSYYELRKITDEKIKEINKIGVVKKADYIINKSKEEKIELTLVDNEYEVYGKHAKEAAELLSDYHSYTITSKEVDGKKVQCYSFPKSSLDILEQRVKNQKIITKEEVVELLKEYALQNKGIIRLDKTDFSDSTSFDLTNCNLDTILLDESTLKNISVDNVKANFVSIEESSIGVVSLAKANIPLINLTDTNTKQLYKEKQQEQSNSNELLNEMVH